MRVFEKFVLVVAVACLGTLGTGYAACKTDACRRATAWKTGYTAVVLDEEISSADYRAALDAITKNGGVVAIEAERVILGWVPAASAGKVRQTRGVKAVLYDRVTRPSDLVNRAAALAALGFFNDVQSGAYEDQIEKSLAAPGLPLAGDVLPFPWSPSSDAGALAAMDTDESRANLHKKRQKDRHQEGETTSRMANAGARPNSYANQTLTKDMTGRVTVQLFRLDSNGATDPNIYSWTNDDMTTAYNQAMGAFTFWVDQANARGVMPALSFRPVFKDPLSRYTRYYGPTYTKYEAVTRPHTDNYLWVNDALAYVGYAATTVTQENVWSQVDAFNASQLNDPSYGAFDRSFSVFISNNEGDPGNGKFTDGMAGAFTYRGGPYTIMLSNSSQWSLAGLGTVLTHETAHEFWACDEYVGYCQCTYCETSTSSPRSTVNTPLITNSNCEDPQFGCGVSRDCMMKNSTYTLCPYTPGQIGWPVEQ